MAKKKATHKGTCQYCRSVQLLPNGVLSNHGYTIKYWGYDGTCKGSGALPLEVSNSLIDYSINLANYRIEQLQEEIIKLQVNPVAWKEDFLGNFNNKQWNIVELNEEGDYYYNKKSGKWQINYSYKNSKQQTLQNMSTARINFYSNSIKELTNYIIRQESEKENWTPQELKPR